MNKITLDCNIIKNDLVNYNSIYSTKKALVYELELSDEFLNNLGIDDDIDKIEFYIKPIYKKNKVVKSFEWINNEN